MRKHLPCILLVGTCWLIAGCTGSTYKHTLKSTQGNVRFSVKRRDFYEKQWLKRARVNQPRICAGFVHKRNFGHYLKYGRFHLYMTLQVYKGGTPVVSGGEVTDWTGGELLRTIKRRVPVGERNNSYCWCGRLQKGGLWKVGAMRFTFVLQGEERATDEQLARGILPISP